MTWQSFKNPAQNFLFALAALVALFSPTTKFLIPHLLVLPLPPRRVRLLLSLASCGWPRKILEFSGMVGGKSKGKASQKADSKLATKKSVDTKKKAGGAKGKGGKDPNKPKRPPSAFFVFMEQFRKEFKEKNPRNKQVSVVGKAGGDKWKSLSDSEKAPYFAKAEKLKAEYQKKVKAYDAGKVNKKDVGDEDSDKSKSEVSEEEEEGSNGGEEEDEDD
ncbi:DNA-binding protein MNB1B [Apostasia shenzhenica]|uniref:DNA-binding protein MNB1B n=1 Tax=Apostasia shenzhenica TaxID=1088818 RepID=A0A2I0BF36_9ASPA|nr:DNA-binding protein MNB1B [Apostasia shenzhenica]